MNAVDVVLSKAAEARAQAAPHLAAAATRFREDYSRSSKASNQLMSLSKAIQSIAPTDAHVFRGHVASNSNHADWHILRQILVHGPAFAYITPHSLKELDKRESTHFELLAYLSEKRLLVPLLQQRRAEDWEGWSAGRPEIERILAASIAPGEVTQRFNETVSPNIVARQHEIRQKLSVYESLNNRKRDDILYDLGVFETYGRLNSLAFRIALLELLERPSADRYKRLLEPANASDTRLAELHDGTMFEYRLICGPAYTCFGGQFIMLGWAWDKLMAPRTPDAMIINDNAEELTQRYEKALRLSSNKFDRIDWDAARDKEVARNIMRSLDALIEDDYWDKLATFNAKRLKLEKLASNLDENFFLKINDLEDEISKNAIARTKMLGLINATFTNGTPSSAVSVTSGALVGFSELGCVSSSINSELPEDNRRLVAENIVDLFTECKEKVSRPYRRAINDRP